MSPSIESGPVLARWRRIPGPPRDRVKARLLRLYVKLERHFGPQRWWPGRTAFEIAVGAVLTQHTSWDNAARAVASLRAHGLLVPRRLDAVSETELAPLIRSAGTYRLKARRLKTFTRWLAVNFAGRLEGLRTAPLSMVRRDLLGVSGLGPETVDAILLYAAGRPVFVADAYTRRILARHRLLSADVGYEVARAFLEAHLPSDPALFNEFHALLVAAGKRYCREVAHCAECPIRGDLTTSGASKGPPSPPNARKRPGKAVALLDNARVRRTRSEDSPGARPRRGRRGGAHARPSP